MVHETDNPHADLFVRVVKYGRTVGPSTGATGSEAGPGDRAGPSRSDWMLSPIASPPEPASACRFRGAHPRYARNLGTDQDQATSSDLAPSRRQSSMATAAFLPVLANRVGRWTQPIAATAVDSADAATGEPNAEAVQLWHQAVDDDRYGDGGEHERTQHRVEPAEPPPSSEVEEAVRVGKTAIQIGEGELGALSEVPPSGRVDPRGAGGRAEIPSGVSCGGNGGEGPGQRCSRSGRR